MDLSRWSDREAALGNCFSKRIVIASNIVEQGHNPPRDFMNFIISRGGYYGHNLRQRAGRVGEGGHQGEEPPDNSNGRPGHH
ncbi:hypothetical protein [Thermogymnomonas acidicola]|uniref:hypothetical protein n=1 Tax=Thermogymnomonas acidicola TaxID=399579 RepID=UPI001396CD36|nr:hypothetical protein [Thermogymnomonas acidicola]